MITVRTQEPVVRIVVTEDYDPEGVTRMEVFDSFGLIGFEQLKSNPEVRKE
jgi:hypothetical protein